MLKAASLLGSQFSGSEMTEALVQVAARCNSVAPQSLRVVHR